MHGSIASLPTILNVSLKYQYEDDEVKNILSLRLAELKKSEIYTPPLTVGNAANSLTEYLTEEKPQHHGKRMLLIPYNKSGGHWFGLVIKINSLDKLEEIIYIDSLREDKDYFNDLCQEVKFVYGSFTSDQIKIQKRLKQKDSVSCGPLTIENLIQVVEEKKPDEKEISSESIRQQHVILYDSYDSSFYERQRTNTNRVASRFQQNLWLKKAGKNFREKELLRISKIINLINKMPILKKDLFEIFTKQSDDEKHRDHLDRLKKGLLSIFNKNSENKFLEELLRTMFNLKDVEVNGSIDLGSYRFQLDYEELSEICQQIDNKEITSDLEKNLRNSINSQMETDEVLARKIQMGLWKEKPEDKDKELKKGQKQYPCLRYIFQSKHSFIKQFKIICDIQERLDNEYPAYFIAEEPLEEKLEKVFMFVILFKNQLIIIHPQGVTLERDLFDTMAEMYKIIPEKPEKNIYLLTYKIKQNQDRKLTLKLALGWMHYFSQFKFTIPTDFHIHSKVEHRMLKNFLTFDYRTSHLKDLALDESKELPASIKILLDDQLDINCSSIKLDKQVTEDIEQKLFESQLVDSSLWNRTLYEELTKSLELLKPKPIEKYIYDEFHL